MANRTNATSAQIKRVILVDLHIDSYLIWCGLGLDCFENPTDFLAMTKNYNFALDFGIDSHESPNRSNPRIDKIDCHENSLRSFFSQ